jgi:fumarate reductase flavoprotein subunit
MVERCADCGFDLAAGRVEVIPTAHYMMGGVVFREDCSTALPGLFAAGEDTGGVHGANRLGGNGVANSTVFGGIAGDAMAEWVPAHGAWREPDEAAIEEAVARARVPLTLPRGDIEEIREHLYDIMWEDAGIFRDAKSLERADATLRELAERLARTGVNALDLAFNIAWHDWLNLESLVLVSRAIVAAAAGREESRGAHFRSDFPDTRASEDLAFTKVSLAGERLRLDWEGVRFTRIHPGKSLLAA